MSRARKVVAELGAGAGGQVGKQELQAQYDPFGGMAVTKRVPLRRHTLPGFGCQPQERPLKLLRVVGGYQAAPTRFDRLGPFRVATDHEGRFFQRAGFLLKSARVRDDALCAAQELDECRIVQRAYLTEPLVRGEQFQGLFEPAVRVTHDEPADVRQPGLGCSQRFGQHRKPPPAILATVRRDDDVGRRGPSGRFSWPRGEKTECIDHRIPSD